MERTITIILHIVNFAIFYALGAMLLMLAILVIPSMFDVFGVRGSSHELEMPVPQSFDQVVMPAHEIWGQWTTIKAKEWGNAETQHDLAKQYYYGKNGQQDDEEAAKLWHRAAEQGHVEAQRDLGLCYWNGEGVPQNHSEAVKWIRSAAEQEDNTAQCLLGACYYLGEGVLQDLQEAAEQGDVDAQYQLALCYYHGEGIAENKTEAVKWYRRAAEQGHVGAKNNLGVH